MGTISLSQPQIGQPDTTEDVKIQNNFTTLQNVINGGLDTNNLSSSAAITATQLSSLVQQMLFAPGDLKISAVINTPAGWLLCDGSAVSRSTYSALFSAISTAYGTGDGSTTFNVPDLRGRVPMGAGTGTAARASAHARGSQPTSGVGGEETHVLVAGELPSAASVSVYDSVGWIVASQPGDVGGYIKQVSAGVAGDTGVRVTPSATNNLGNATDTPHNTLPPVSVLNVFIKT